MTMLLRLRRLKEEQALRALQAKRREVAAGEAGAARARAVVAESLATLPAREDAVYRAILGSVVDQDALEDARGAVVALQQAHGRLVDAAERAAYVLHRLRAELDAAVEHHRQATRRTQKYVIVRDDLAAEAAAVAVAAEEGEVEEMFGTRKGAA